jgi:hypothetical protein
VLKIAIDPAELDGLNVNVTVALPVVVLSARLLAVTVTVCWLAILDGARYSPEPEIEPEVAGEIDHATA